jgi:hypothetical protein
MAYPDVEWHDWEDEPLRPSERPEAIRQTPTRGMRLLTPQRHPGWPTCLRSPPTWRASLAPQVIAPPRTPHCPVAK